MPADVVCLHTKHIQQLLAGRGQVAALLIWAGATRRPGERGSQQRGEAMWLCGQGPRQPGRAPLIILMDPFDGPREKNSLPSSIKPGAQHLNSQPGAPSLVCALTRPTNPPLPTSSVRPTLVAVPVVSSRCRCSHCGSVSSSRPKRFTTRSVRGASGLGQVGLGWACGGAHQQTGVGQAASLVGLFWSYHPVMLLRRFVNMGVRRGGCILLTRLWAAARAQPRQR